MLIDFSFRIPPPAGNYLLYIKASIPQGFARDILRQSEHAYALFSHVFHGPRSAAHVPPTTKKRPAELAITEGKRPKKQPNKFFPFGAPTLHVCLRCSCRAPSNDRRRVRCSRPVAPAGASIIRTLARQKVFGKPPERPSESLVGAFRLTVSDHGSSYVNASVCLHRSNYRTAWQSFVPRGTV